MCSAENVHIVVVPRAAAEYLNVRTGGRYYGGAMRGELPLPH